MNGARTVSGHLFFFYAFEAGFEIDLEKARPLCEASDAAGITGQRPSPPSLQYRPKPLIVPAGTVEADLRGKAWQLEAAVKIFDFGALSVTLTLPVTGVPWDEYRSTAVTLSQGTALQEGARAAAMNLFDRVRPAITRPLFSELVEEYSLWHVSEFSPPLTGTQALEDLSRDIARLLTLEEGTLSRAAVAEVLRTPIRYFDNDLFLADWNSSFAFDPKFQDTLEVLEFLNVQLLELRYFDRRLSDAIDVASGELHPRRRFSHIFHDPYEEPMNKLSLIRTDVAVERERIYNVLRLVGDAYLTRVYEETRRKVEAEKHERAVLDKLAVLTQIYTMLNNQAQAARTETLELIIILLILIEIVMGLLRW